MLHGKRDAQARGERGGSEGGGRRERGGSEGGGGREREKGMVKRKGRKKWCESAREWR